MFRGCIHSPPLTNNNDNDDDEINEVATTNEEYEYRQNIGTQEIVVHDLFVRRIFNYSQHFHTYSESKIMQSGHAIYTFKSGDYDGVLFGQHFHTHRSPKEFIHLFIYSFMHLCDSIHLLQNEKVVHGNLNLFENILVRHDLPIIADFSSTLADLFNKPYSSGSASLTNGIIPLELHLMRYISQHRLQSVSEQNVEDVVYDVYSCHELLDPVAAAEEALVAQAYLMRFVNVSRGDIETAVRTAAKTWDVYMLCANYWKILKEFKGSCSAVYLPHLMLCEKLFRENMRVDPALRCKITSLGCGGAPLGCGGAPLGCGSPLKAKELMKKIFSVYR